MSRVFTIPTVLRVVPNHLLKRFFEQLGHPDLGIPWDTLRKRDPKPIVGAIQALSAAEVDTIEAALQIIYELACETGIAAIREAGAFFDVSPLADMPEDATPYHQAISVWLDHRDVIDRAVRIHQVEHLTWWRKRNDLPRRPPDASDVTLRRLERDLSALLLAEEGRGRVCTVERMTRRGTEYYFAHLDDFVQNVTAHDPEGQLTPQVFRQTFPIVFALNPAEGSLELFARLPAKVRPKVEALFARTLLGVELPKWQRRPTYVLNHLKPREFTLDTDPEDGVRVEVLQMRFKYANCGRQVIFKGDPQWPGDTRRLLDEALNRERVPLASLELTMVTLGFEFCDGHEPPFLTLDVACPSSCSLRSLPPNRAGVVRKYLRRWGIDAADPDLAEAG